MQLIEQRFNPSLSIGHSKGLSRLINVNIQVVFGNINADIDAGLIRHMCFNGGEIYVDPLTTRPCQIRGLGHQATVRV